MQIDRMDIREKLAAYDDAFTARGRAKEAEIEAAEAPAELGPPSGWIVVDAEPMAFWLPDGVSIPDPDDAGAAPPNETDEVPF